MNESTMTVPVNKKLCVCGRSRPFSACCEPYLTGKKVAPTAEALMRSRYAAFCTGNIDYLIATHHPDYLEPNARQSLSRSVGSTQWTNLIVLNTRKGKSKDTAGVVEFACAYRSKPAAIRSMLTVSAQSADAQSHQMHERSHFVKEKGVKEKGQWLYTTGEQLPAYEPKKTQSCWCGSGKAFKHCHG